MAVTLTDEQAKNSAASLRASAASSIATADLLDPPTPVPNPPPTIPPAGDLPNLKLIFEDQFLIEQHAAMISDPRWHGPHTHARRGQPLKAHADTLG
jgi:hypothetical protein